MFFHPNKKRCLSIWHRKIIYILYFTDWKQSSNLGRLFWQNCFSYMEKEKITCQVIKTGAKTSLSVWNWNCVCVCVCSATCRPAVRLWSWSWNISGCWSLKRWKPLRLSESTSRGRSGESPSASKYRCVNKVNSTVVRPYEHTTRIKLWVSSPGIIVKNV